MKRIWMMMVITACMGLMAMPASAEKVDGVKVKKEKKVKAPKAPKVKKDKKPKGDKPQPVLEEVVLSGTIAKQEQKGKGDKVSVKYILTDAEGNKIPLPKPKAAKKKKGAEAPAAAINLDDYLDVGVKVTGQGTKMEKKGKTIVRLKTITSVEKGGSVSDVEVFPPAEE